MFIACYRSGQSARDPQVQGGAGGRESRLLRLRAAQLRLGTGEVGAGQGLKPRPVADLGGLKQATPRLL